MVMIPLHYLIAFAALFFLVRDLLEGSAEERNIYFNLFLGLLALQAFIIGTRFGYQVEWLREVQPVTAALLPPFAYLSFKERAGISKLWMHFLPPIIAAGFALFLNDLLDAFLAGNNLFYGLMLARIGQKGSDGLPWAGINHLRNWLVTLWVIVVLLIYSGITDGIISLDFIFTRGQNTNNIIALASIIGIFGTVIVGIWAGRRGKSGLQAANNEQILADQKLFEHIDNFLKSGCLYLDPDLNLNRIARRLALPSRDVSRAINLASGMNVSQYVNTLRIEEACRLIGENGTSITESIYASGFNTKSNFNREFVRVTGKTPSEWREQVSRAS